MRRIFACMVSIFALCTLLFGILWHKEIQTVDSLKMVSQDKTLFFIDYTADYDLNEMLSMNINSLDRLTRYILFRQSHGLLSMSFPAKNEGGFNSFGCTSFNVRSADGDWLLARNFDYDDKAAVLLASHPKDGYASFSLCDPYYVGLNGNTLAGTFREKSNALGLLYCPVDGMNEKGLAICVLELTQHPAGLDTPKDDVLTSTLIRVILDKCATVEEAVKMIEGLDVFDMAYDPGATEVVGSAYHYQIVDAQGNSVVVEFDYKNGFSVLPIYKESKLGWQICTNHYLSPKYSGEGDKISNSWGRYDVVQEALMRGPVTEKDCMQLLSSVALKDVLYSKYGNSYISTQWSVIYNLTALTATICTARNYATKYTFYLSDYQH
jgi:hypothetical protein